MTRILDYQKTWLTAAFIGGILLTLGFKDFYPDLERRFRRRRQTASSVPGLSRHVSLMENDKRVFPDRRVPEGVEGTIGNTPLFKIKSLSEATGCEILAKAEVDA